MMSASPPISIELLLAWRRPFLRVTFASVVAGGCCGFSAVGIPIEVLANTNPVDQSLAADSPQTVDPIDAQLQAIRLSAQQRLTRLEQDAQTCSLDQCLLIAVRQNPSLKASAFSVQQAAYGLLAARQSWSPTLTASGSSLPSLNLSNQYAGWNGGSSVNGSNPPRRNGNKFLQDLSATASIGMQWDFLDPQREPSINSQLNALKAQRYLFITAGRQLVNDVQTTYFDSCKHQNLLQAYVQILDGQWITLQQVQASFVQGLKSKLDVSAAQSQYSQSLTQYLGYLAQYEQGSARLARLLSLPVGSVMLPNQQDNVPEVWDASLAESIQSGLENNEEIKTSLSVAEQQRWQGIQELNTLLPTLGMSLGGAWGSTDSFERSQVPDQRQSFSGRSSSPSWVNQSQYLWSSNTDLSAALGFQWKFFDGGQTRSSANADFAAQKQNLERAADQKNEVAATIRSQFETYQISKLGVAASVLNTESSSVALEAARERYAVGYADITTLIERIQAYSQAVIALQNAMNQRDRAVAELQKTTAQWPNQQVEKAVLSMID